MTAITEIVALQKHKIARVEFSASPLCMYGRQIPSDR